METTRELESVEVILHGTHDKDGASIILSYRSGERCALEYSRQGSALQLGWENGQHEGTRYTVSQEG